MKNTGTIQQKQLTFNTLLSYGYAMGTNESTHVDIEK